MKPYDIVPILERIANLERRAVDLIFSPNQVPKTVIDGRLEPIGLKELSTMTAYQVEMLALGLLKDKPRILKSFVETGSVETSLNMGQWGRFRAHIFRQRGTPVVIMRVIPPSIPTFETLGLPKAVQGLVAHSSGLCLVTGLAGSGKSTTLAAAINHFNNTKAYHIITIEDPLEFLFSPNKSVIHQRELGNDAGMLDVALKQCLRMAPNVLVVCELRGRDSILAALEAAAGKCLVLSTLPTSSAAQTIEYLVNAFPTDQEQLIRGYLGQTLKCVVTQRLIPRADGKGRIPMAEVLQVNTRARDYIIEGDQSAENLEETMRDGEMDGMQTYEMDLKRLLAAGLINEQIINQYKPKSSPKAPVKKPPVVKEQIDLDAHNIDEVQPLDLDRS